MPTNASLRLDGAYGGGAYGAFRRFAGFDRNQARLLWSEVEPVWVVPLGSIRLRHSTIEVMTRKIARAFAYSVFYEQAAEGGYVASVPALPGCHTQGETLEETERNVKEAIALYLESLAAHGEAIPEEGPSFQGRVTVPVPVPV